VADSRLEVADSRLELLGESHLAGVAGMFDDEDVLRYTRVPNPVPPGTKYGKTTINWSTGDGSKGVIRVLMKSHRIQYPPDGGEAIEQLETLRAKGGEFLLIRRELVSWLEDYKGLKERLDRQYRIIQDDDVCRIYDLRRTSCD